MKPPLARGSQLRGRALGIREAAMKGMTIFCSLVIMLSAIGAMLAAVESTRHAEYGYLTVAAAVVFSGGLIGRCVLEVGVRVRDDA